MKRPEECKDIQDIRTAIDTLDHQIIEIIGQRAHYVKKAAQFKKNTEEVKAPERVKAMLYQRRVWAEQHELHPDIVEELFSRLVTYFQSAELTHFTESSKEGAE